MGMPLVCMLAKILWRSRHSRRPADLNPTELLWHMHSALL